MFYILVLHNTKQSVDAISAISAISTFLRRHRLFLILDVLQVICGQLRERAYLKLGLDIFPMTTYCLRRDEQPVGYLLRIQTLGNQFHNLCLSIRELTIQARLAYHPLQPALTSKRAIHLLKMKESIAIHIRRMRIVFTEVATTKARDNIKLIQQTIGLIYSIQLRQCLKSFRVSRTYDIQKL